MQDKKPNRRKRLVIFGAVGLVLMLAAGYVGFSLYFSDRYYWGTTIDGMDCSCMKQAEVEAMLQEELGQYVYTINEREGMKETIGASELQMSYIFHEDLGGIKEQQKGYLWFRSLWKGQEYHLEKELQYDQDKLWEIIGQLECFDAGNMVKPADAYISDYMPDIKGYEIIGEIPGNLLFEEAKNVIAQAVADQRYYVDLDTDELYQNPKRTADDAFMNAIVAQLNHYTRTVVIYRFGEETEILDGDRIHEWLSVRGRNVYLDKKAAAAYISELAAAHDTYYSPKPFTTAAGEEKELRSGYGFLMDVEEETEALLDFLETGGHFVRTPAYKRSGANYSDNNIGGDYVEIDLTGQYLYLYLDGECVLESDIVSGCMNNGNGTPEGIYDIDFKSKNTVLRGPTWESYVNYWMPFNGAVGMHDATWRGAFGGNIYRSAGSHGCVNLPYAVAEELYGYVYAGMPVVCYY